MTRAAGIFLLFAVTFDIFSPSFPPANANPACTTPCLAPDHAASSNDFPSSNPCSVPEPIPATPARTAAPHVDADATLLAAPATFATILPAFAVPTAAVPAPATNPPPKQYAATVPTNLTPPAKPLSSVKADFFANSLS